MIEKTSTLQKVIEAVEALDIDAQILLIDIITKRLNQQRRDELLKEVAQAQHDYEQGSVRRGSVEDLMAELED
ncbi:hypothetical protein [Brasilonema bromeliae]|uniref:Addiction module component n=1 Tax=Brasilonema bromeliae SPC951 TaxID=385972 RepID=A0ABX1PCP5_9CYAN|nr:hypothetical protein [Brasilonema bromeliae]NMG22245.1 hypothetical protein [Brasilonema bromeliae SPC951]